MQNQSNNPPIISVIIACYNSEEYIAETLHSVLSQSFRDFEVIVVNDGSTDKSLEILEKFKALDSRLKIINQSNTYYIQARHNALPQAQGEFLLFLDSDDKIRLDYLQKAYEVFIKNPNIDVVYCDVQYFEREDIIWHCKSEFSLQDILRDNQLPIASLIRRTAFEKVGGYDTKLFAFEDWDLWIRLKYCGSQFAHLPETLFWYRKRSSANSICDGLSQTKNDEARDKLRQKNQLIYEENGWINFQEPQPSIKKRKFRAFRHAVMRFLGIKKT